jgi:uncharacterized protein YndB with AHSA1/START domain
MGLSRPQDAPFWLRTNSLLAKSRRTGSAPEWAHPPTLAEDLASRGPTETIYSYEVQIAARPDSVFEALTTSRGIANWWAKTNAIRMESSGEFLSVDFGKVKKLLRVERESSSSSVSWHVLECTLTEWPGTTITFQVLPAPNSESVLSMRHIGLSPQLRCYESCSMGWAYFMNSLKSYLEMGSGSPH